jgi:hypothetical protein
VIAVKKEKMFLEQKGSNSGIMEQSGALVTRAYRLSELPGSLVLRIEFSLGDDVSIAGMSIGQDERSADENW